MIVVFGHTNDEKGKLSAIAKSRCEKALELWEHNPKQHIVVTGTIGAHFNTTNTSHAIFLKEHLKNAGVIESQIITDIVSTNTFQDVLGIRKLIVDNKPTEVHMVTSDFHYARVKFYCDLLLFDLEYELKPENIKYYGVEIPPSVLVEKCKDLVAHEQQRMKEIQEFPKDVYLNANAEQKHYDTVSNWMITGQFTAFALGYSFLKDPKRHLIPSDKWLCVMGVFTVMTCFWYLYTRAAGVARTSRRILRRIEYVYGQPGFSLIYNTTSLSKELLNFKVMFTCLYIILASYILAIAELWGVYVFGIGWIPCASLWLYKYCKKYRFNNRRIC